VEKNRNMSYIQIYKGFLWQDFEWERVNYWKLFDRFPVELGYTMVFKKEIYKTLEECIEIFKNQPDLLYENSERFKFNV